MNGRARRRPRRGSCFIECLLGGALLIPIGLGMVDLGTLLLAAQLNDAAARQAARSAANEQTEVLADKAATTAMDNFAPSQMTSFDLNKVTYAAGQVSVETSVDVRLPIQLPFLTEKTLVTESTMPIIATAQIDNSECPQ
jgi:Flp pilus assembly protein TadG